MTLLEETQLLINDENRDPRYGQELFWQEITKHEGETFYTATGLDLQYSCRGYEIYFNRKSKSLTRSSLDMAYATLIALRRQHLKVTGPKKLKVFGASYVYAVMIGLGLIDKAETTRKKKGRDIEISR